METERGQTDLDAGTRVTLRVVIAFEQFRALVLGKVVDVELPGSTLQLVLEDVGYPMMLSAVAEALAGGEPR